MRKCLLLLSMVLILFTNSFPVLAEPGSVSLSENYQTISAPSTIDMRFVNFTPAPDLTKSRAMIMQARNLQASSTYFSASLMATSSTYGAAWAYTKVSSTSINCYGYAARYAWWLNPGDISSYSGGLPANATQTQIRNYFTVNNIANKVITDLGRSGRSARIINNGLSTISSTEYRIAVRTGIHDINGDNYINLLAGEADYHFMLQHSNGSWSSKAGSTASVNLGAISPRTYRWDLGTYQGYYDSATIYLAVKK